MLSQMTWSEYQRKLQTSEPFPSDVIQRVKAILQDVKQDKDHAVRDFTKRFDQVDLVQFKVSKEDIEAAYNRIDPLVIEDMKLAYENIRRYHEKQLPSDYYYDVIPGGQVGQRIVPIDSVGLYVPGGTAAYPSTVLMNAVPAIVAGVPKIVMISPPNKEGQISDIILVAANIAGITEVYKVGGAQGIAALAYGTETIPKVDKIVGPGNIYVALAKREVYGTVGIDMVAGPSEILVVADASANPVFVASDLLSQAEHDTLARPLLVTTSQALIDQVNAQLRLQLKDLSRRDIAETSLQTEGRAILVTAKEEALEAINQIAPEHLELLVEDPDSWLSDIRNAGAVFVGPYSPEPLGDYLAGPNHTLPTSGTARFASALNTTDFIKRMSVIRFDRTSLSAFAPSIERFATTEGLTAHAKAISRRMTR